jgi:hypothetical protein
MKAPLSVWFLELGTGWRCLVTPQRNLRRAEKCANALMIRRPDIDRIEIREGDRVCYRLDRKDLAGWI